MSVVADAMARIFADPAWSESATFTAPPAAPVSVRFYRSRVDEPNEVSGLMIQAPGWTGHLLQAEVPTRPRPGVDTVTVDGTVLHIRAVEEDAERTEWWLGMCA